MPMSDNDFSHSDGKLLDTETDGSTVRPFSLMQRIFPSFDA
jgi:hypothetical protein